MNFLKKKSIFLLFVILIIIFTFSACKKTSDTYDSTESTSAEEETSSVQDDFDEFIDEMFVEEVSSDLITLHFTLSDPSSYGITDYDITIGDMSIDAIEDSNDATLEAFDELCSFDYDELTSDQQLTYDVLYEYIELNIEMNDLYLYSEVLSSSLGDQAQIPIILAEYSIDSQQDLDDYLELLCVVDDYFDSIIEFETAKSESGLFMSDEIASDIIDQCEEFIEDPESNYLISSFDERIDDVTYLDDDEKEEYKALNEEYVLDEVIPAYESLISGLESLMGTGTNDGGLCNFPDGTEYYEYLVQYYTGSDKSVEEIKEAIEEQVTSDYSTFSLIYSNNPDIESDISSAVFPYTDPEEALEYLSTAILDDFPEPVDVDYTISYVTESLEDYLSPAFFISPTIDDYYDNSIYINSSSVDSSTIFSTLAHEGFPGHMYQMTYYSSTNPPEIRELLYFMGYTEGWAIYAEYYSYSICGLDSDVAAALQLNDSIILAYSSLIDIGVNYEGWDMDDVYDCLLEIGIDSEDSAEFLYYYVIENPANYLAYYVGYLEILELQEEAMDILGDDYTNIAFNQFLLEIGPSQFYVIDDYMEDWLLED